jgi:hypothetical protein
MPSGEKQQGETMALFLGPVVGGGASRKTANAFFSHITNFVSQRHSVSTRGHQFLEPRVYLNVDITDEQHYLLQPTGCGCSCW